MPYKSANSTLQSILLWILKEGRLVVRKDFVYCSLQSSSTWIQNGHSVKDPGSLPKNWFG